MAGVDYRPAKSTRVEFLMSQLNSRQIELVDALIHGLRKPSDVADLPIPAEEKMLILDLVVEMIQYRYVGEKLDRNEYRDQLLAALRTRSELGRSESPWQDRIPVPPRPDDGHDSKRFTVAAGVRDDDFFHELRFRAALTDLTDMDYIHQQGAQIEFLDLRSRYYPESEHLVLQSFDLLDIISISPRNRLLKPMSWMINTGWQRKPLETDDDALIFRVNGGAGYGYHLPISGIFYAMAEGEIEAGGDLSEKFALGGGISMGTIIPAASGCKIHLFCRGLAFFAGDNHLDLSTGITANFRITTNNHLTLNAEYRDAGTGSFDTSAAWHFFF